MQMPKSSFALLGFLLVFFALTFAVCQPMTLVANPAQPAVNALPPGYALDFLSGSARGVFMNDAGVAAGVRFDIPPGCTPATCQAVPEYVVWAGELVFPLPELTGRPGINIQGINNSGWVVGTAGAEGDTHPVVWKPTVEGYEIQDLGLLPGTEFAKTALIDDLGRVVGYFVGTTPQDSTPFVWTEETGLIDLSNLGFPNETPLAISPGGMVATSDHWYSIDDPESVTPLAPPPQGFRGPGAYPVAINDAGDQARFQISTTSSGLVYLFRYDHNGTWQQLWNLPGANSAPYGIGSINSDKDITATVGGIGLIAAGPDGVAVPLSLKVSPAYGSVSVSYGGAINESGEVLAQVSVGRNQRLVRLVAPAECPESSTDIGSCLNVAEIEMTGRFIHDPRDPGHCTPRAANLVFGRMTVKDERGYPIRGATIHARLLDDYYLDWPVVVKTNFLGTARFSYKGPACVGAIAVLVDDVEFPGKVLDRNEGKLTEYVIPLP